MRQFETQVSVYGRLSSSIETQVFDCVPSETKLPYVVLGESVSVPDYTKTTNGERITQTIYIFSNAEGKEETFFIAKDIDKALSMELIVEGAFVIDQKIKKCKVLETDQDLFQGVIEFEILIEEME